MAGIWGEDALSDPHAYIDAYIAVLPQFEGQKAWLYLDTRKVNNVPSPLVTGGIGCAISLAEAITLPFTLDGTTPPLGASATMIEMHYRKVQGMQFGHTAEFYRYAGCLMLSVPSQDALVRKRLVSFESALIAMFPDFLSWPYSCKIATMDMIYNLGAAGLQKYTKWTASCKAHNWSGAAAQCESNAGNSAYDARNNWRRQQFLLGGSVSE